MIKEALEYLKNQFKQTEFHEAYGQTYTNDEDLRLLYVPIRKPIRIKSLTGLVDYIKDDFDEDNHLIVVIEDERNVIVQTELNKDHERETLIVCNAQVPVNHLNSFLDAEEFNIQLQSTFVPNEDSKKILSILGNLKTSNVKNIGDNGVSQQVETRKGVTLAQEEVVPNPVELKPFRTFTEIPQPESLFVFRLRERSEVQAAIFEADGGAWVNKARLDIKDYLAEQLKEDVESGRVLIVG